MMLNDINQAGWVCEICCSPLVGRAYYSLDHEGHLLHVGRCCRKRLKRFYHRRTGHSGSKENTTRPPPEHSARY